MMCGEEQPDGSPCDEVAAVILGCGCEGEEWPYCDRHLALVGGLDEVANCGLLVRELGP